MLLETSIRNSFDESVVEAELYISEYFQDEHEMKLNEGMGVLGTDLESRKTNLKYFASVVRRGRTVFCPTL